MADERSEAHEQDTGEAPPAPPSAPRRDWLRTVARATETVAPLVARQAPKPEEIPSDRRGRWATLLAIVGILTAVIQFLLQFFDLVTRPLAPLSRALPYLAAALIAAGGIYAVYAAVRARTRRQRLASLGLAGMIFIVGFSWAGWLVADAVRPPSGYRILIGEFDGTAASQQIDFARRIAESLRNRLAGSDVPIELRRTTDIFPDAESAIDQGRRQKASLVIWGWYDDQGVSPHVELLELPGTAPRGPSFPLLFARAQAAGPTAAGVPLDATLSKIAGITAAPATLPELALFAEHGPDQVAFVTGAILGLGMLVNDQDAQARQLFDQALAAVEGDPAAQGQEIVYYQRALLNYEGGQPAEAKADLEAALALRPAFPEAHTLLALLLAESCTPALDLVQALVAAEEAAALQPGSAAAQRLVAEVALQAGDVPRAGLAAAEAQRLAPEAPAGARLLAAVYAAQGQMEEAAAARTRLLALLQEASAAPGGATADNLVALGDAYLANDDYAQARATYLHARDIAPRDPRVARGLANVLYWEGNRTAALEAANEGAKAEPADSYWPMLAGLIAHELGRTEEATMAWAQAAQLNACDPAPHLLLGNAAFTRGDLAAAGEHYRQAVAIAPHDGAARFASGAIALATGDHAAAADAFALLARQMPDAPDIHYWLGAAYDGLGETAQAQTAYAEVVRIGEQTGPSPYLAYAYAASGRLDQAIATYVKLLAAEETADLHTYLGMAYVEKGVPDLAAAEFAQALALQPAHEMALLALGNLQFDQGEMAAAAETYGRYLQLENSPVTQFMVGTALQQLGDLEAAYPHFQEADRLQPQDPQLTYQAGLIATWLGRLEEATAYLETAQRLQPQNANINLLRATVAQKACRPADAIAELKRAVALAPENALFQAILAGQHLAMGETAAVAPILENLTAAPAGDAVAHWMAGSLLATLGEATAAAEQFDLALAAPELPAAVAGAVQTARGELAWRTGDAPGARQALTAALAVDPDLAAARAALGVMALLEGANPAAVDHFEAARHSLAAYGQKYSYDSATILEPVLFLYTALAQTRLGNAVAAEAAQSAAAAQLAEILQATPAWPHARLGEGMLATLAGDEAAAESAFRAALACDATLREARARFEEVTGDR